MASVCERQTLSLMLTHLEEQHNRLSQMYAEVNNRIDKVLHQGNAWLEEDENDLPEDMPTYQELYKIIEDTSAFIAQKCAVLSNREKLFTATEPQEPMSGFTAPSDLMVTDGKQRLQYDRNYLMELRFCAASQKKPEGLPNLEIILDHPIVSVSRSASAAPLDYTPLFFMPERDLQKSDRNKNRVQHVAGESLKEYSTGSRSSFAGAQLTQGPDDLALARFIVSGRSLISATGLEYKDLPVMEKMKPLTEEEMESEAKAILKEYLKFQNLEMGKLRMKELEEQPFLHVLVTVWVIDVLEKSDKERELIGHFFHEMIKNDLLSLDLYLTGLAEVLQFAENMLIDIPEIWTNLAQIIVPLLMSGSMPWSKLPSTLKPYLDDQCCAALVAEIVLVAKTKTNETEVAQMWQRNGLDWTALMDAAEVDRFLKEKNLEFTVSPVSSPCLIHEESQQ